LSIERRRERSAANREARSKLKLAQAKNEIACEPYLAAM
jgi:hypothetical protein